jgi:hypothetical protein
MNDKRSERRSWTRHWPWGLLALIAGLAAWYTLDFEGDVDAEFPAVARPTFSRRPSPAYRLAEPGDTLDRVGLYLASGAVVVSTLALLRAARSGRGTRSWLGALAVSLAAYWYAANPGPTFDGWHGLGWRTICDPSAPAVLRMGLAAALAGLAGLAVWGFREKGLWARLREFHLRGLLVGSAVLTLARQFEIPGVEPAGFWPRWAWVGAMTLWVVALCRAARERQGSAAPRRVGPRLAIGTAGVGAWLCLVVLGVGLFWFHRPLERFRPVVPGRIYISAMPTYSGLDVAHKRHNFKTIINLFPESTLGPSPRLPEELRFAREHNIRYVESPGGVSDADGFLDQTLQIAQDPDAWPILVHCHGCMDRTPAWMGIYRFVVQGRPLREIMAEIEGHRGYRPKASVTLLYNRVLPPRAPERYAADPTAEILRRCAAGTRDPYDVARAKELAAGAALIRADQRKREAIRSLFPETPGVHRGPIATGNGMTDQVDRQ